MAKDETLQRLLFVPDSHHPFHSVKGWAVMLKAARSFKPDTIICIGDLLDFYSVSSHSKNPNRAGRLLQELEAGRRALDALDSLDATRKIFIAGNHEDRLHRYLQDKAPELFDVISIPGLLGLADRAWEYVPYRTNFRIGKLYCTHDLGDSGRNSTHRALDRCQHSIVIGHSHRLSYVVEGNALGEMKVGAQFGWLGDANQVDYMHQVNVKTNWALGFGVGYLQPSTGIVYLQPIPIVNQSCVLEGELFKL